MVQGFGGFDGAGEVMGGVSAVGRSVEGIRTRLNLYILLVVRGLWK